MSAARPSFTVPLAVVVACSVGGGSVVACVPSSSPRAEAPPFPRDASVDDDLTDRARSAVDAARVAAAALDDLDELDDLDDLDDLDVARVPFVDPAADVCPVDADGAVTAAAGDAPVVVVASHAGLMHPQGCDPGTADVHDVGVRTCTPDLDACASGPCRAAGADRFSRELATALVDELTTCLHRRPSFVVAETARAHVDMNRDVTDPLGPRCAYDDPAALPLWQAFHGAVEDLVDDAARVAPHHALLVDVHTNGGIPAAPAPAVMLGAGLPFGATLPHRRDVDPTLSSVFSPAGLRARLLQRLAPTSTTTSTNGPVQVFPVDVDGASDALFNGRTIVHRYSSTRSLHDLGAAAVVDAPAVVDALQLEVSSGLREDPASVAAVVADALCATLLRDIVQQ